MPDSITCTGCRAPVAVPRDHADPTIRCGICWTEVAVAPRPAAAKSVPALPVAQPLTARPTATIPGVKPAAGMAKLEGLIQKAGARLAGPAATATATPAIPVATLKPKTAEAVPLPSIQPVPVPVTVAPVPVPVPVPVQPAPVPPPAPGPLIVQGEIAEKETRSSRRRDDDDDRPSYKRRRDDDDDDDDDRRSRRRGEGGNAGLIGVIVGGVALFVLLGVGVYYLTRPARTPAVPQPDVAVAPPNGMNVAGNPAIPFNLPNPDAAPQPAPGFNPFQGMPNVPPPNFGGRPPVALNWAEYAGDGYKVKFGSATREGFALLQLQDDNFWPYHARGKSVKTTDPPAAKMEVITVDAPQGLTPDLRKLAEPFGRVERVTACKVADRDGFEYEDRGGITTTTRIVQVGCRVFVFKFTGWEAIADKASVEEAKKTFFDSISITFDPATPAPAFPPAVPKNPRANPFPPGVGQMPNPVPGFPPAFGGLPAGLDALKLAGRIDPFLAVVMFPDRQEAYTVALRPGSRTQGELRRYEYPGFKLKNTYLLPLAGTFAVGSDQTNRLAITTLARTDGYVDGERSIVVGDVQLFDLTPIFADKTPQREELKPLATLTQPTGTRLAGLEMSPDGGTIYYATLAKGAGAKPFKVRLSRADAVTGKPTPGSLDLPEPVWRTRLSADGGRLFAAEVPLNAAGAPAYLKSTNIVTVDLNRWLIERTDLVAAGTAFDILPLASDSLAASVIPIGGNGTTFALWSLRQPAQATALDVPGQSPLSHGYIARTADGKRLVTSSSGGDRWGQTVVEVYDVTDWKAGGGFKRVASARVARVNDAAGDPGVNLGHNFELTPDGQYALFCHTGAIVDLSAIGKK